MANITAKDGAGNLVEIAASGDGNSISPFVRKTEVTNFPATQPVSGSVSITNQPAFAFDANGNLRVNFPAIQAVSGSVSVSNFPATQAISAASLPLPAGAATEVTLATISGKLPASIGTKIAAESLAVTLSSDGLFAQAFGTKNDNAAGMDTASVSFISLFKRLLSVKLPANLGGKTAADSFPVTLAPDGALVSAIGTRADAAATSDTDTVSSLIGLVKRLLSVKLPSALTPQGGLNITGSTVDIAPRTSALVKRQAISISTSGDNVLVPAVTGQTIKVLGIFVMANADVTITLKSGTTNLTGGLPLGAKGGGFLSPHAFPGYHPYESTVGGNLVLNLNGAVAVGGSLVFIQE